MMKIKSDQIQEYINFLRDRGEPVAVVNKKLRSIKKFAKWAKKRDVIIEFPKTKITLPRFDFTKNYVGLVILLIFMATLGAGIYSRFFSKTGKSTAYSTVPTFPGVTSGTSRIISFQGRLTDSVGNPIYDKIDMVFSLYKQASGGTALYTGSCTGVNGVTPDQDGIFNVLIGSDCGMSGISSDIFSENPYVYLGVTVGTDSEMPDRQLIANVGYALNSETLQGLPPGTDISNIPYINAEGNLLIAAASPSIRTINESANFALSSAKAVTITSASSGDVALEATESGNISLRTGGNNDSYSRLFIENGGNVGIGTINPGSYKLNVNGSGYFSGTLTTTGTITAPTSVNTINGLVISAGSITNGNWLGSVIGTTYGGTGANLSSATQGSIPYFSSGAAMTYLSPSTSGYVLTTKGTGANPEWVDPSVITSTYTYWNQDFGALFPKNNTVDLLVGGESTTSAKFAVTGINDGTANIYVAGNVGIGTTSPSSKLSVEGDIGAKGVIESFDAYGNYGSFSYMTGGMGISSYQTDYIDPGNILLCSGSCGNEANRTFQILNYDGVSGEAVSAFTGNVGIGTTSPSYKLHVVGNGYISTNLNIGVGLTTPAFTMVTGANNGYVLTSDASGNGSWQSFSSVGVGGTGTANYLSKWLNGTTLTNSQIYDDSTFVGIGGTAPSTNPIIYVDAANGNVGIGTTAPSYLLSLQGANSVAVVGNELLTDVRDRDFSGSSGNWSGTNWTIGSGVATHTAGANNFVHTLAATAGTTYQIKATINTTTAGTLQVNIGNIYGSPVGQSIDTLTQHTWVITAADTTSLRFIPDSTWAGTIDDVTVKVITPSDTVLAINNSDGTLGLAARSGGSNYYNTFVGIDSGRASYNTSGDEGKYNSSLGYQALYSNTTGNYNSAMGFQALFYNTTGYYNSAIGAWALYSNTTGNNNSAMGYAALTSNTTGNYNSAMGEEALISNTTGNSNSAMGNQALVSNTTGNYNSAMGFQALFYNTTGNLNSGMGFQALFYNTTGNNNSAMGVYAGQLTSGGGDNEISNNSVYLGYDTRALASGDTNEIVIGASAIGIGSNSVVLGNDSITKTALKGNVGIGTTAPVGPLHIVLPEWSNITNDSEHVVMGTDYGDGIRFGYNTTNNYGIITVFQPGVEFGDLILQGQDGYVGIGTTSPFAKLDVAGTAWLRGSTLTSGLFVASSGNVGIGTTAPTSLLHLYSTSTSTSFSGFSLDWQPTSGTTSTADLFSINIGPTANVANLLNIKDNGSSLFSVSENQITSALPHQFTSSGDVSIAYDLIFTNQTSSNIKSYGPLTIEAGENFESNDLILKTYNKGNVIIDTSASSVFDVLGQLSVDSYATIGASLAIGNTSAAAGPGNLNLTGDITGEEDNKIKIGYFTDAANEDFGLDPAAGNAIFNGASLKVSAGALLAVNSGSVGIGTTSPQAKLDIVGNTTALTASELKQSNIYMNYTNSNTNYLGIWFRGHSTSDMFFGRAPASDDLIFSTANQSQNELVRIRQNGNIGIGTTAPTQKLTISGGNIQIANNYGIYFTGSSAGDDAAYIYTANNKNRLLIRAEDIDDVAEFASYGLFLPQDVDYGLYVTGGAYFNYGDADGDTDKVFIKNGTGNVGIGTASPSTKLDITVNSTDAFVRTYTAGTGGSRGFYSGVQYSASSTSYPYFGYQITDTSGPTNRFYIDWSTGNTLLVPNGGNVGIGTMAPTGKLEIAEDGVRTATDGNVIIQHPTSGSYSSIVFPSRVNLGTDHGYITYYDDSNTYAFWGDSTENSALVIGTENDLMTAYSDIVALKGAAASVIGTYNYPTTMVVDNNGYVGIGTNSPKGPLHIYGIDEDTVGIEDGKYLLLLTDADGGSGRQKGLAFGRTSTNSLIAGIQPYIYSGGSAGLDFFTSTADNTPAFAMRIDNGGNVGIGTTTPNQKLDVRGSIVTGVDGSGGVLILAATDSTNEGGQIEWHGASTSSDWYQDIYLNRFRIWSTASSDTLTLNDWGNVGIGVAVPNAKLQVNGIISTGGSYVMRTYSSSTVPTRNNDGEFGFYRSGSTSRLYYRAGGTNYYINSSATGDFSEYFLKNNQSENFITGQIVSLNGDGVKKTTSSGESPLGVISAFGTRNFDDRQDGMRHLDNNYVNVAIIGQAPVLVTSENGPINPGDKIVSGSNYAGFGVRKSVIKSGQYISIAKQKLTMNDTVCSSVNNIDNISWPKDIENYNQENICYKLPNGIYVGRIMSYINSSWDYVAESDNTYFDPYGYVVLSNADQTSQGLLTSIDDIRNATYNIMDSAGNTITKLDSFAQIMVGKITSGLVETTNAIVNNVLIAKYVKVEEKITSPIVETEEIQLKAQNSKLKTTTENSKVSIVDKDNQTTVEFDTQNQQTSIFGNLNIKNDSQKGKLAKLIIDGLDGKTAASIDSSGNATFSGTIAANEATISGKLYAKEIESSTIDSLSSNISSQSSTIQTLASSLEDQGMSINEIQALLAEIRDESLTDLTTTTDLSTTTNLSSVAVSTDSATLASLTVTSSSNLYDVSVANSLAVGNILIENDKILSFSWNLKFSALSTVDFFDSAVVMAKDGTITTQGSLIALGGVKTNNLSAVNENDDISVKLGNSETENSLKNAKLKIENSVGDEVASIDASGSAKFKELALEQFNPATPSAAIIAASANFAKNGIYAPAIETATASAGVGILPANEQEVLIYNDRIYDNSLIYLTPVDQTDIKLSVVKKEKYFKVVTDETSSSNVKFNWLIIN